MDYFWFILVGCSVALAVSGILASLLIFSLTLFMDASDRVKNYLWYGRKTKKENFLFIVKTYSVVLALTLLSPIIALPLTINNHKKNKYRYRSYK